MTVLPFIVFPALIVTGLWLRELSIREAAVFVLLWFVLRAVLATLGVSAFFVVAQVLLDAVLILMIFKGDPWAWRR